MANMMVQITQPFSHTFFKFALEAINNIIFINFRSEIRLLRMNAMNQYYLTICVNLSEVLTKINI